MKLLVLLFAFWAFVTPGLAQKPAYQIPEIVGEFVHIFDPNESSERLAEAKDWYTNDHTFIKGEDGSWPQAGVRTPSTGTVYADKAYRIRKISTSLDAVTFETEVNNGISYRFTGRVRQTDERDGSSHESRTGDIIGKLEKLRNGTVVASMESTFYLFGR